MYSQYLPIAINCYLNKYGLSAETLNTIKKGMVFEEGDNYILYLKNKRINIL